VNIDIEGASSVRLRLAAGGSRSGSSSKSLRTLSMAVVEGGGMTLPRAVANPDVWREGSAGMRNGSKMATEH
jgi:hypothetical protein